MASELVFVNPVRCRLPLPESLGSIIVLPPIRHVAGVSEVTIVFSQIAGAGVLTAVLTLINSSADLRDHAILLRSHLVRVSEPLYQQLCGDFNLGRPNAIDPTGEILSAHKTYKLLSVVQRDRATSILSAPPITLVTGEQWWLPYARYTMRELRIEPVTPMGALGAFSRRSGDKEACQRGITLKLLAISQPIGDEQNPCWLVTVPNGSTLLLDVGKGAGTERGTACHHILFITPERNRPTQQAPAN